MKLKTFFLFNAIVSSLSGLSALLIPTQVLTMCGVDPDPAISLMAQYSGLGSLAIGLITWFSKNMEVSQARRTLVPALLITYVIGTLISILGTTSGIMAVGLPVVGLYFIFALGYFYFQFFSVKTA